MRSTVRSLEHGRPILKPFAFSAIKEYNIQVSETFSQVYPFHLFLFPFPASHEEDRPLFALVDRRRLFDAARVVYHPHTLIPDVHRGHHDPSDRDFHTSRGPCHGPDDPLFHHIYLGRFDVRGGHRGHARHVSMSGICPLDTRHCALHRKVTWEGRNCGEYFVVSKAMTLVPIVRCIRVNFDSQTSAKTMDARARKENNFRGCKRRKQMHHGFHLFE